MGGARNSNNASLRNRAGGRGAGDGGWELPPPDEESIAVLMVSALCVSIPQGIAALRDDASAK